MLASCGATGVNLGTAESFRTFENRARDILIVELVRSGRTHVFALSSDGDGNAIVENLTGALAVAAGRLPTAHIDNLALEYRRLPVDGTIEITEERQIDDAGRASSRQVNSSVSVASVVEAARQRSRAVQTPINGGAQ